VDDPGWPSEIKIIESLLAIILILRTWLPYIGINRDNISRHTLGVLLTDPYWWK